MNGTDLKILVDTNVIMDEILSRKPFCEDSRRVIEICSEDNVDGFLAAHTITNIYYLLRKGLDENTRRNVILNLFKTFQVIAVDSPKLIAALRKENFKDFEDCLQVECAEEVEADYIITRDKNDFSESQIQSVTPAEFCKLFEEMERKN